MSGYTRPILVSTNKNRALCNLSPNYPDFFRINFTYLTPLYTQITHRKTPNLVYFRGNNLSVKGVFRIGGAVALGILIILGSLYMVSNQSAEMQGSDSAIISKNRSADSLEILDSDGDGIPDWKEQLQNKAFKTITAPTSTSSYKPSAEYIPPTTLTGKFSEAFLQDYLEGKMAGRDFSDTASFVNSAVQTIEASARSPRHTRAELNIIPSTYENVRSYGNEIVATMNRYSQKTEGELGITQRAIENDDASLLVGLEPIRTAYERILSDTISMPVPDLLAIEHVSLLNAYEAILLDIIAMQSAFIDPLYALARIKVYESDTAFLSQVLQNISVILDSQGIVYSNIEPGAFFYIFDAL